MKINRILILAAIFAAFICAGAFAQGAGGAATAAAASPATAPAAIGGAAAESRTGAGAETKKPGGDTLDDALNQMDTADKFTVGKQAPEIRGGGFAYLLKVLFSLFIVVVMIIVTVFILKQIYARSMRIDLKGHHVRVVDVVQLGVNRTVYLLSVGDRALLLGTGEKGLVYIDDVTDAVNLGEDEEGAPAEGEGAAGLPIGVNFRKQLNEALGIRKKDGAPRGPSRFNASLKDRIGKLSEDEGGKKS